MPRYEQDWRCGMEGFTVVNGLDENLDHQERDSDPYQIHSVQKFPLGARLHDVALGRVFRYALAGATALQPGKLVQMPVPRTDHKALAIATLVADAKTVTVTNGATNAIAANEYAGGLLVVDTGASGLGEAYRIKSNEAAATGAAFVVTLYDAFQRALTGGTHTVTLLANPFGGVIIHPSPPTAKVVGVPIRLVTASYYCWLQTKGPAPVLTDGTVVIASKVAPSGSVDGAVAAPALTEGTPNTGFGAHLLGEVLIVNTDTKHSVINLDLE